MTKSLAGIISKEENLSQAERQARELLTQAGINPPEQERIISGLGKLYQFATDPEARLSLISLIIRLNLFSKPKGDLKEVLLEEETGKLSRQLLDRQFEIIKAFCEEGEKVILVTPETNPNFNDIMHLVDTKGGATVTQQGGPGAHAIIIATQFGYCVAGGAQFSNTEILDRIKKGERIELTVDGNRGFVYLGIMHVDNFYSFYQISRWGMFGRMIGLITNATNEMEKASKLARYWVKVNKKRYPYMKEDHVGAYMISLDRIEEILMLLGIDFRAAFAYQRMVEIEKGKLDESTLTPQQRSDVEKMRSRGDIQKEIQEKIRGFVSPVDFLRYNLSRHFLQMVAVTKPGQVIQIRARDFKKREIIKTQTGAELFYNYEEASMIGDRGTGLEVRDENIEALDLQLLAISDAIKEAKKLGDVGSIGFMFVFIRRLKDFKKGLWRIIELYDQGRLEEIPKEVGAMFELTINAIFAKRLMQVLLEFQSEMRKRGIEITVYISHGTNDQTQSVKGSRDEIRYVAIDVFLPDGRRIKDIRTFYEGDPGLVDNVRHGNAVAKKMGG